MVEVDRVAVTEFRQAEQQKDRIDSKGGKSQNHHLQQLTGRDERLSILSIPPLSPPVVSNFDVDVRDYS